MAGQSQDPEMCFPGSPRNGGTSYLETRKSGGQQGVVLVANGEIGDRQRPGKTQQRLCRPNSAFGRRLVKRRVQIKQLTVRFEDLKAVRTTFGYHDRFTI